MEHTMAIDLTTLAVVTIISMQFDGPTLMRLRLEIKVSA